MNKNPLSYAARAAYVAGALASSSMTVKADEIPGYRNLSTFLSALEATQGADKKQTQIEIPAQNKIGEYGQVTVTLMSNPGINVKHDERPINIKQRRSLFGIGKTFECFYSSPDDKSVNIVSKDSSNSADCYGLVNHVKGRIDTALSKYASESAIMWTPELIERIAKITPLDGSATFTFQVANDNQKHMEGIASLVQGHRR